MTESITKILELITTIVIRITEVGSGVQYSCRMLDDDLRIDDYIEKRRL